MAARTGKEYLERLAASRPTVPSQGETVTGGSPDHPAFRTVVQTCAPHSRKRTLVEILE